MARRTTTTKKSGVFAVHALRTFIYDDGTKHQAIERMTAFDTENEATAYIDELVGLSYQQAACEIGRPIYSVKPE